MPLYEYRCETCDDVVEILQKFSDEPLKTCTKCGGSLERLLSPPGLHFKGSGWYITDYARSAKGSNGDKAEKTDAKTESKPETKSETKTEPKLEKSTSKSSKSGKA
jgi:putative FmdB family regulatory protein